MLGLLSAQGGIITGKVTDNNGEPLAGANVFLNGTSMGATTDSLGQIICNTRGAW